MESRFQRFPSTRKSIKNPRIVKAEKGERYLKKIEHSQKERLIKNIKALKAKSSIYHFI